MAGKSAQKAACRGLLVWIFVMASGNQIYPMPLPARQSDESQSKAAPRAEGHAKSVPADSGEDGSSENHENPENRVGPLFLKHVAEDQKKIWTSPARVRPSDAAWLVPAAGIAATLFATDRSFSRSLSTSSSRLNNSQTLSNYSVGALAGAGAALYLWGKLGHDEHKTETAILGAEAAINSLLVVEALKYSTGRDRPQLGGGGGRFFQGGTSFPSEHSAAAWSIASMFAHEYPGPLTSVLAYGIAATTSISRLTAKQHFPSDVFVGGLLGWWISRHTYRAHHDYTLGGTSWEPYRAAHEQETRRRPRNLGSPYVPLESWVYPAFERLAAMGFAPIMNFSIKPWTRMECATLAEEASEKLTAAAQQEGHPAEEAVRLDDALKAEFSREIGALAAGVNESLELQSAYARVTSISGSPLTDGFHFGQTISYDDGRPDRRGTNAIAGGEIRGTEGPFAFFVQTEYQHAPSAPGLSLEARTAIANADHAPLQAAAPFDAINRSDIIQGYISYSFHDWQLTAGKQTLSWGPSTDGALAFSNNAEPFPMVRLTQLKPPELPGFLKYLYPARIDNIFGRLEGHTIFPRPFIFGQKATLEWGPYVEFSYSRYTIIGGQGGDPLNTKSWFEVLFGRHCTISACASKGAPPGESATGSDITLRVPGTRGALLLYVDLYSEDDAFAWRALSESIYRPGIYIARLPKLPRLDLRIEVANSKTPFFAAEGAYGVSYTDTLYLNGFTNNGFLMGNTVGRDGQAIQASSSYWFTPRTRLQLSYKNSEVDRHFIPQGGKWQDYGLNYQALSRSGLSIQSSFQFEHISRYPILFNGAVNNVAATLTVGYQPNGGLELFHHGRRAARPDDSDSN